MRKKQPTRLRTKGELGGHSDDVVVKKERTSEPQHDAETTQGARGAGSGESVRITASAGFGEIGGTVDQILRRAELALFKARASGPSGFQSDVTRPSAPLLRRPQRERARASYATRETADGGSDALIAS